jgi:hypothetical protein
MSTGEISQDFQVAIESNIVHFLAAVAKHDIHDATTIKDTLVTSPVHLFVECVGKIGAHTFPTDGSVKVAVLNNNNLIY